ncbi:MAG: hypothetical protein ACREBC_23650 [Pyrinomonadaceae bacterium]
MHRPLVQGRLIQQISKRSSSIDDHGFLGLVPLVFELPELWELADPPVKNKILNFISSGPDDLVVAFIKDASEKDELRSAALARVNTLSVDLLSQGIINQRLGWLAVPRAIEYYKSVGSWNRANEISEKLILPLFDYFSPEEIDEILRIPKEHKADLVGSTGFLKFIQKLRSDARIDGQTLIDKLTQYDLDFYVRKLNGVLSVDWAGCVEALPNGNE